MLFATLRLLAASGAALFHTPDLTPDSVSPLWLGAYGKTSAMSLTLIGVGLGLFMLMNV